MISVDIVFEWVKIVSVSYVNDKWFDKVKIFVVQMFNWLDVMLYECILVYLEDYLDFIEWFVEVEYMVLMMFEFYVDIYECIINLSSVVDYVM